MGQLTYLLFILITALNCWARGGGGSIQIDMTLETALKEPQRADYSAAAHFTLIPSYKLSDQASLNLRLTITQDLTENREATISTAYIGTSRKLGNWGANDFISLLAEGRVFLPLDKQASEQTSYRGGFSLRPSLKFDLSKISIPSLRYTLRLSYTENFHQYKTFNNAVNNQRTLSLISILEVQITERFAWNTLLGPSERWNYRGTHSETYLIDSSLEWSFSQEDAGNEGSLSLGYSAQAPTQTATGENNIKLYDNENGYSYVTLAYLF